MYFRSNLDIKGYYYTDFTGCYDLILGWTLFINNISGSLSAAVRLIVSPSVVCHLVMCSLCAASARQTADQSHQSVICNNTQVEAVSNAFDIAALIWPHVNHVLGRTSALHAYPIQTDWISLGKCSWRCGGDYYRHLKWPANFEVLLTYLYIDKYM